jgi:uncharacterized Zn-finger protein
MNASGAKISLLQDSQPSTPITAIHILPQLHTSYLPQQWDSAPVSSDDSDAPPLSPDQSRPKIGHSSSISSISSGPQNGPLTPRSSSSPLFAHNTLPWGMDRKDSRMSFSQMSTSSAMSRPFDRVQTPEQIRPSIDIHKFQQREQNERRVGQVQERSKANRAIDPITGKRRFICPKEDCGKSFTTSGHLARHNRVHTGEKPAYCQICNRHFGRKDNMEQHKKTHYKSKGRSKGSKHSYTSSTSSMQSFLSSGSSSPMMGAEQLHAPIQRSLPQDLPEFRFPRIETSRPEYLQQTWSPMRPQRVLEMSRDHSPQRQQVAEGTPGLMALADLAGIAERTSRY